MKKWVALVAAVLFGALMIGFIWTKDTQVEPPVRMGRMWAGKVGDGWVLSYVTGEERARRRALTTGRNPRYTQESYYRYRLRVHTLPGGELAHEIPLGDVKRNQGANPQIVGLIGDTLWLHQNGLKSFALPALTLRYDQAALQKNDPAAADLLPTELKHIKVLEQPAGLLVRGRDARFHLVDPINFALTPISATSLPKSSSSTRPENWFDFLRTPAEGRTLTSPSNQMKRFLVLPDGKWFGMLSESELADMPKWVPVDYRPSGDVARSLYRGISQHDGRYAVTDPKKAERMGDGSFVQAGFLVRHNWIPWTVADPDSMLVLGRRRLDAAEPWQLTRLSHEGRPVWQTGTGLVELDEFVDAGPWFVVAGRVVPGASRQPKSDQRERIVWIDEKSGAKTTILVPTGAVHN